MRTLLNFFLLLVLSASAVALPPAPAITYEAQVVVHIDDLDDEAMARLSKAVGREKNVSIEYSCVWSGVVVLKFAESPVSERADVISLARRLLSSADIEKGVEYLHVFAEARGPGRC
jgi:ABC-type dipeptide/oligopeptide/nickel transport system permease component